MARAAACQLLVPIVALALGAHPHEEGDGPMAFTLKSTAFSDGAAIPAKYTCDGDDVSPPLAWSDAPARTASFALISDDPDAPAGTWVHWVLYNVPAATTALPENVAKVETLDLGGARQGRNDFHRPGYGGPCPPPGPAHHYFFKLYALDTVLQLRPAVQKKDLERAIEGHTLGMAQLMGTYARKKR
ncbi:MAG TPA: YbhB/YbcL family Raf kinase inhibitor-like protein [Gemmatimonadales bacterium]|nr:YbhB/YbcL family Raf kinase inhibitor-like protein [Gemmatimonadales bacterium]